MRQIRKLLLTAASACCFGFFALPAAADEKPYTEGSVVSMAAIRTTPGHFDDYMKHLDGPWKQAMEAAKKSGLILSYQVLAAEPRTPDDPDIYLIVTFKNWAAMDGMSDKFDAIEKQIFGSLDAGHKGMEERAKIRRELGSQTLQVLNLK